jgi:hypothetical protein
MSEQLLVNPTTGEVLDQRDAEGLARHLAAVMDDIAELQAELGRLREEEMRLDIHLRSHGLRIGMRIYAGEHHGKRRYLVCVPPDRRPAQRVNAAWCAKHSEQLLDMGLGYMQYKAPTAAEVRRKAGELVAAGIDVSEVLPEPNEPVIGNIEIVEGES